MSKDHPHPPLIPPAAPIPAGAPSAFEERPFSSALKRLIAVYDADRNRLVIEALNEATTEMALPEGAQVNVQRGVFIVPVPPPAKLALVKDEPPAPEAPAA